MWRVYEVFIIRGINHNLILKGIGASSPEFGERTLLQIVPPDFVMFQKSTFFLLVGTHAMITDTDKNAAQNWIPQNTQFQAKIQSEA